MQVTILASGHVELVDKPWRGMVEPHDEYTLDKLAPNLPAQDRQDILDKWATVPVPTPPPPRIETYLSMRIKALAQDGYGTAQEQLEILGEQGIDAFQVHVAAVKAKYPKP